MIFNSTAEQWKREARHHGVRHIVEEGPEIPGETSAEPLKTENQNSPDKSFKHLQGCMCCHVSAVDLQEERPG